MMLEAAQILASVGALVLLVAGAFWIKVARYDEVDDGGNVVASQVESASQLLALAVVLSLVAASLAVVGWIAV
jgi:hypothetical protein